MANAGEDASGGSLNGDGDTATDHHVSVAAGSGLASEKSNSDATASTLEDQKQKRDPDCHSILLSTASDTHVKPDSCSVILPVQEDIVLELPGTMDNVNSNSTLKPLGGGKSTPQKQSSALSSLALPGTKEILRMRHMSLRVIPSRLSSVDESQHSAGAPTTNNFNLSALDEDGDGGGLLKEKSAYDEELDTKVALEKINTLIGNSPDLVATLNELIVGVMDLRMVKLVALKGVCKLMDVDQCSIFLREGLDGAMIGSRFDNETLEMFPETQRAGTIQDGSGVLYNAMNENKPSFVGSKTILHLQATEGIGSERGMLCLLPLHVHGEVLGLVEAAEEFSEYEPDPMYEARRPDRVEKTMKFLRYAAIAVNNALQYRDQQLIIKRRDVMLKLTTECFSDGDLASTCQTILCTARELVQAERCSLFVVDEVHQEFVSMVVDNGDEDQGGGDDAKVSTVELSAPAGSKGSGRTEALEWMKGQKFDQVAEEIRFSIHIPSIVSDVYKDRKGQNIPDAYEHKSFNPKVDKKTGFVTKSVLCVPLFEMSASKCIGVIQLVNKKTGIFTGEDESLLDTFSLFFSYTLNNAKLVSDLQEQKMRVEVSNEIRAFWYNERAESMAPRNKHLENLKLTEFNLNFLEIPSCHYTYLILDMIDDPELGIHKLDVHRANLIQFIKTIAASYRNLPYHNWNHGFQVTQFMYACLRQTKFNKYFRNEERLCLLIACLCHDVDHRGTNNAFQVESCTPLARLYVSSTLERHHFDQVKTIMSFPGHDFLASWNYPQRLEFMTLCENLILATDLKVYFKNLKYFNEMSEKGFDHTNASDRESLFSNLMTAADVSSSTKPWEQHKEMTTCIYDEFFFQGDEERALGIQPHSMYDRANEADIPKFQIGFFNAVASPVYMGLAKLDRTFDILLEQFHSNRARWDQASRKSVEEWTRTFNSYHSQRAANKKRRDREWSRSYSKQEADSKTCSVM